MKVHVNFFLKDIIYYYGCIRNITTDRDELDVKEEKKLFSRMGIKIFLTTTYNPKNNGKSE